MKGRLLTLCYSQWTLRISFLKRTPETLRISLLKKENSKDSAWRRNESKQRTMWEWEPYCIFIINFHLIVHTLRISLLNSKDRAWRRNESKQNWRGPCEKEWELYYLVVHSEDLVLKEITPKTVLGEGMNPSRTGQNHVRKSENCTAFIINFYLIHISEFQRKQLEKQIQGELETPLIIYCAHYSSPRNRKRSIITETNARFDVSTCLSCSMNWVKI